jgi:ribokinase
MSGTAVVIGSVHMDLIARAERFPGRGESVSGGIFSMAPGGKGANQAIQLALNNVETTILARVGNDEFGRFLTSALQRKGVNTDRVGIDPDAATGASTILAAERDYASIIAPGAAGNLARADLEAARSTIEGANIVVLQWELPTSIVGEAMDFCADLGKTVVFNASPVAEQAAAFTKSQWQAVDWLVVNRFEAMRLAEVDVDESPEMSTIAQLLRTRLDVGNVVITLGREGSLWLGPDQCVMEPARPATVVDTVGAGDAFLGTLAAGIVQRIGIRASLSRASVAGAIAVSRSGAYYSLPNSAAIDQFAER